jgi:Uma2 family endonuclease
LVVTALPLPSETGPNETLGYLLTAYKMAQPTLLDATLPEQIVRTPDSRRRADRLIWIGLGRLPKVKKDLPAIIVEFVSASKKDRGRDYQEKRREYWIIDRFRRIMTVIRPGRKDKIVREKQSYSTPLLPKFKLAFTQLLAVADDWALSQTS